MNKTKCSSKSGFLTNSWFSAGETEFHHIMNIDSRVQLDLPTCQVAL